MGRGIERQIAVANVEVVTRPGFDPTPYNRETLEKLKAPYSEMGVHPMLHPPETAVVAEAETPIHGVVTDAATGRPRAGVTVTCEDPKHFQAPRREATTDANGRYEIHGVKKTNQYQLSVKRDPEAGLTPAQLAREDEYVRMRIRENLINAAYGGDAATRFLLESDPQLLRSLELFPEAKALAENVNRQRPSE